MASPQASARLWGVAVAFSTAVAAGPADAHGFGQRYELPLPLSLYLFGGAAVVALSFVVFVLFVRQPRVSATYPKFDMLANPVGRAIAHPAAALALGLTMLGLFGVTVLAGLIGDQNPYRNIAPTLVWIIWWVGFAYVSAFVGNLWVRISPWRIVFDGFDWLSRQLGGRRGLSLKVPYPEALGAWPACALLLAFSWTELVYPDAARPAHIAVLTIAYSLLSWGCMFVFGRDVWLENGEIFALFFGLFSRLAPTEAKDGGLYLRPFGAGFLGDAPVSISKVAFVLLILASVLYDGLIGTPEWANFEATLQAALSGLGEAAPIAIKTAALIASWLLFLGAFLGICTLMSTAAAGRPAPLAVARGFALTLIPIAIGYHIAHYLVYLLIQGQYIIPLASDPFGYGWNLFGTADYRVDIALAGARFSWYLALAAIVVGHVTAVYLAHVRAFAVFEGRSAVLRSQLPLTALMVVYTFIGLTITAEPIVARRTAAEPTAVTTEVAVPADALLPEAETGRLQPVGDNKLARLKLTYQMLGSAFQDGTRTTSADLLYAFAFAVRWSTRSNGTDGHYDPVIDAATAPMREHLVALRVTDVDSVSKSFRVGDVNFLREIFTVETYLDLAADDSDWDAAVAPPFSTLPWHLLVLMEEAVTRGWAAFSREEAQLRGVAWLDLVRSKELTAKLASLVKQFARDGHRPDILRLYVSEGDARKRWDALDAFYQANGHFLVTNGPYTLKRWSPESVTLDAFRDLSYPLGVGSYDVYAIPRRGFITQTEWTGDALVISADIEIIDKFQRSYRLVRAPLQSIPAVVVKRAMPECRYLVTDAAGRVVLSGVATIGADAKFQVNVKGRLTPGRYTISAFIAVNGNAITPDIRRMPVVMSSSP
jgi:hypothetical protein